MSTEESNWIEILTFDLSIFLTHSHSFFLTFSFGWMLVITLGTLVWGVLFNVQVTFGLTKAQIWSQIRFEFDCWSISPLLFWFFCQKISCEKNSSNRPLLSLILLISLKCADLRAQVQLILLFRFMKWWHNFQFIPSIASNNFNRQSFFFGLVLS